MPTTNLGLATINQSDNISPTPINDNMQKIDALGIDYITAQGTSGSWRYRRWKSGTYECWARFHYQTVTPDIQDWDEHFGFKQFTQSYPITFADVPCCFVSTRQDGNNCCYATYIENSEERAEWYVGGLIWALSADVECNVYAIGRVS